MALNLQHDSQFHTNGRLGVFFAQTEVEVYEVKELKGEVVVEKTLAGNVCIQGNPSCTPPGP